MKLIKQLFAIGLTVCLSLGGVFVSMAAEYIPYSTIKFPEGDYSIVTLDTNLQRIAVVREVYENDPVYDNNIYIYDFQGNLINSYCDAGENFFDPYSPYWGTITSNGQIGKCINISAESYKVEWYNLNGDYLSTDYLKAEDAIPYSSEDVTYNDNNQRDIFEDDDGNICVINSITGVVEGHLLIETSDISMSFIVDKYFFLEIDNGTDYFENGAQLTSEIRIFTVQ